MICHRKKSKSLVIVTVEETAATVIENVKRSSYGRQYMLKSVLMDPGGASKAGSRIDGVEVVAGSDTVMEFVCREWVDEVLIALPKGTPFPRHLQLSSGDGGYGPLEPSKSSQAGGPQTECKTDW